MFDLQVAAYQADMTRVITFMLGRELNGTVYPGSGVPDGHHNLTHHRYDPVKVAKVEKINAYHVKLFSEYYLAKLRSTPDGDGSLLDHMLILYGGGISDGNLHDHSNLPLLLVGGSSGQPERRPPPRLSRQDADDESAGQRARQGWRADRAAGGQHR